MGEKGHYCIPCGKDWDDCKCATVSKSHFSGMLSDLADAWDKAAEHYNVEAEKQPTTYLKGIRAGASYKLESCANELRALIKEAGR